MPEFSPTKAAFEGFRFTRERPGAVAAWAGATLAFNLVSEVLGALMGGPALAQFNDLLRSPTLDVSLVSQLFPPLVPVLAITMLITVAACTVICPSALRTFLGLDRKVTFGVGQDERRILLILIVYVVIFFVASAATGVCLGFLENIAAAFSGLLAALIGVLALPAEFLAPLAIIVRLSLALVIAVDRKRINLRESWVSTKGHFWPLSGSLALAIVLYGVVAFVGLLVVVSLAEVISIPTNGAISPGGLTRPQLGALADLIKPAAIVAELITALLVAMLLPVIFAPLVRAYLAYDAPDPWLDDPSLAAAARPSPWRPAADIRRSGPAQPHDGQDRAFEDEDELEDQGER
jgi:hypothetical protein